MKKVVTIAAMLSLVGCSSQPPPQSNAPQPVYIVPPPRQAESDADKYKALQDEIDRKGRENQEKFDKMAKQNAIDWEETKRLMRTIEADRAATEAKAKARELEAKE